MKINNPSEFFQFIKNYGLTNLSPETSALIVCMEEYGRLCNCDKASTRKNKANQCRAIYVSFISKAGQFKNQLLSKIADNHMSFYVDGQIVSTITR
jgi:hypothetical protein